MIGQAGNETIEKTQNLIITPCQKTTQFKAQLDTGKAIIYMKLRSEGCKIHKAIKYCKVNHCKTDISQSTVGPEGYKILRQSVRKEYMTNVIGGWLVNIPPTVKMGNKFIQSVREVLKSDEQDEKQQKNLENQKKTLKYDYLSQESSFKQYIQDVNNQLPLNGLTLEQISQKIKDLNEKNQDILLAIDKDGYNINGADFNLFEIKAEYFDKQKELYDCPLGNYPNMLDEDQIEGLKPVTVERIKDTPESMEAVLEKALNFKGQFDEKEETNKQNRIKLQQEAFNDAQYILNTPTTDLPKKKPGESGANTSRRNAKKSGPVFPQQHSQEDIELDQKILDTLGQSKNPNTQKIINKIKEQKLDEEKTNKLIQQLKDMQQEERFKKEQMKYEEQELKKKQFQRKIGSFIQDHISKCYSTEKLGDSSLQIDSSNLQKMLEKSEKEKAKFNIRTLSTLNKNKQKRNSISNNNKHQKSAQSTDSLKMPKVKLLTFYKNQYIQPSDFQPLEKPNLSSNSLALEQISAQKKSIKKNKITESNKLHMLSVPENYDVIVKKIEKEEEKQKIQALEQQKMAMQLKKQRTIRRSDSMISSQSKQQQQEQQQLKIPQKSGFASHNSSKQLGSMGNFPTSTSLNNIPKKYRATYSNLMSLNEI